MLRSSPRLQERGGAWHVAPVAAVAVSWHCCCCCCCNFAVFFTFFACFVVLLSVSFYRQLPVASNSSYLSLSFSLSLTHPQHMPHTLQFGILKSFRDFLYCCYTAQKRFFFALAFVMCVCVSVLCVLLVCVFCVCIVCCVCCASFRFVHCSFLPLSTLFCPMSRYQRFLPSDPFCHL